MFRPARPSVSALVAAIGLALAFAGGASAERDHRVGNGETLSSIARKYGVSVGALAAANDMKRTGTLRLGQSIVVPDRGVVIVRPGQTLASIARANHVSVGDLMEENGIKHATRLRPGDRLALPDTNLASIAPGRSAPRGRASSKPVTFRRYGERKPLTVQLVDRRGRANRSAITRLGRLMKPRKLARRVRVRRPDGRLVEMLARVAEHFPGHSFQVISGFRAVAGYTKEGSRHTHGRALDFRIDGVKNEVIRDFCRTLPNVGVGYYPKSKFIHLDVRDRNAYWIDWSGPGEAPRYEKKSKVLAVDAELDAAEDAELFDLLAAEGPSALKDDEGSSNHDPASDDASADDASADDASDEASD